MRAGIYYQQKKFDDALNEHNVLITSTSIDKFIDKSAVLAGFGMVYQKGEIDKELDILNAIIESAPQGLHSEILIEFEMLLLALVSMLFRLQR